MSDYDIDFEGWYSNLKELATKHVESVADRDAWREEFDLNKSAMEAFYEEYPEHKPKCNHENSIVRREGMTGTIGTVICQDCGYERDWDAY